MVEHQLQKEQQHLRMPGAVLMTRLQVYDSVTPDGQIGGTPHVHLVCTEMYVVLSGGGAVEIIDKDGFSRVELKQHDALLFTPGTIHRLINPNRDLHILAIMQNSGLPERGDNVVTFVNEHLATDEAYRAAMKVSTLEEAYSRRNRGVEGFLQLKAAFAASHEEGLAALQRFYQFAEERTAQFRDEWHEIVQQGAMLEVNSSLSQLAQLKQGATNYLLTSAYTMISTDEESKLGFCGHLNRYFDPVSLLPEGIRQA